MSASELCVPANFEIVGCPVCDSVSFTVVHNGRDWARDRERELHIVRCASCGMHYTNPRPTLAELSKYYTTDYQPYRRQRGEVERSSALSTKIRMLVLRHAYAAPSLRPAGLSRLIARCVSLVKSPEHWGFAVPFHGQGRLLDFGCGSGTFLRRMKALGWTVTGVDFSADAVRAVRESGLRAVEGSLPHADLAGERFDLITMRQSLEHLPNPREVLAAIRDLLAPGGLLVVQVPNFASFEFEYFQDAALILDLPRHLLHFTPDTLKNLLDRSGFDVSSVKVLSRAGGLRKSLKQIERRDPKRADMLFRSKIFCQLAARRARRRGLGNELIAYASRREGA